MKKEVLSITVRDYFGLPFVLLLVAILSTEISSPFSPWG